MTGTPRSRRRSHEPEPEDPEAGLDLQAATYTPKPEIYSRAQWGANENLRDKGSLRYFEVHAGFVHHTVNANDYTRAEVPGILRSIYAYHTQSRGWSDVGYNFLVDRFGRIWEGRAGGVDRPVVGAHTLGYNDYAFAMSAIGNFETVQPKPAMLQAYGALMAWKLSLHGVDAVLHASRSSGPTPSRRSTGTATPAPPPAPAATSTPSSPTSGSSPPSAQQDWDGRELESDLAGSPHPDLIVRRASDGQAFILPTGGLTGFKPAQRTTGLWAGADVGRRLPRPHRRRDGRPARAQQRRRAHVRPGTGDGLRRRRQGDHVLRRAATWSPRSAT